MKTTSKKKIIVSTLAIAMGAALAGSISGSVAWYQYSTRAAAQIQGTALGTVGELQIRGRNDSTADFDEGNESNYLEFGREEFQPMSMYEDGGVEKYVHAPVYQKAQLQEFKDSETPYYIDYELQFMFEHRGETTEKLAKNVYLTKFAIEKTSGATKDISGAVRVEFIVGGASKLLLAKTSALDTVTHGNLDLNGNGELDAMDWDCQDASTTKIMYTNDGTETSHYQADAHGDWIIDTSAANFNPYDIELALDDDDSTDNSGKALISTSASGEGWSESVTLRVWLEGWALLDSSASWNEGYINQDFNINMQFACSAEIQ